jgi:hypothetical protein
MHRNTHEAYGNDEQVTIEDYSELNPDGEFEIRYDGNIHEMIDGEWVQVAEYVSKSKKIQQFVVDGHGALCEVDGRWCRVFYEMETGLYHIGAGYDDNLADMSESFPSLETVENMMRGFANLRHWKEAYH